MALIRQLVGAHAALDEKEGALPPLSASAKAGPVEAERMKPPSRQEMARDVLVEAIEHGVLNPKNAFGDVFPFPYSGVNGRPMHGQNILTLAMKAHGAGYESGAWMTHSAAAKNNWIVRKGERHTKVFYHEMVSRETDRIDEETGEPEIKSWPKLNYYQMFNIAQLVKKDGSPVLASDVAERRNAVPAGRAPSQDAVVLLHRIADGMGIEVQHDPSAKATSFDEANLIVPGNADDLSAETVSHLARGLVRMSVSESLRGVSMPDPAEPDPKADAEYNLRLSMAEALTSMHLGFPLQGGRSLDPMELNRLLATNMRAGQYAARDAEKAVSYMLSFDPGLRHALRDEEERLRSEILDAGFDETVFDAEEIDFDYVEARTSKGPKP